MNKVSQFVPLAVFIALGIAALALRASGTLSDVATGIVFAVLIVAGLITNVLVRKRNQHVR